MKPRIKLDKKILNELYIQEKLSISFVARRMGHDRQTIERELIRYNISVRTKAEAIRIALSRRKPPRELLEGLYYQEKLTQAQIAKKLNRSRYNILKLMQGYKLPTRSASQTITRYPKNNFSEDLIEKAYLLGFRVGDLNVVLSPSKKLIIVSCTSTKNEQIQLFDRLFKKYGHVWIGRPRNDGNRVCLARLNHSFDFLLPKKDHIPGWVLEKNEYFFSYLAGYSDAEACIGVFNKLARFTLASYDKNILKQIYKRLNLANIPCNPPRILVKAGHIKNDGLTYRKDHWHLTIVKKSSLLLLFQIIESYLKHKKRIKDLRKAKRNVLKRNQKLLLGNKFGQILPSI